MSYPVTCPECGGSGEIQEGDQIMICPLCEGKGKIKDDPEEEEEL